METHEKVVLVTGAASGIGKACALALAERGYKVAVNFLSKSNDAEVLLKQLEGSGHQLFQADIGRAEEAEKLVDAVMKQFGRIDGLVNAAGRYSDQEITGSNFEQWQSGWQQTIDTNLLGPVNLCYLVAQRMLKNENDKKDKKNEGGKIVNITSRGAFRGEPTAPAYGAAKSALNSASQSLAVALAPHNISVFAIAPGWVDTPMAAPRIHNKGEDLTNQIPLGRVGRPEEIANLVAFLLGPNTEYLTGAIIDANGASYLRN